MTCSHDCYDANRVQIRFNYSDETEGLNIWFVNWT